MLEDTTLPDLAPDTGSGDPEQGARDYETVRRTLRAITERWRDQPALEDLAREAGVQPIQLQRVFSRWAGITPKQFLQAITLDHARDLLRRSATVALLARHAHDMYTSPAATARTTRRRSSSCGRRR